MLEAKTPLISIIVPCYNQAQYLNDALSSVLKQSYANWECIIVNDGSPDNTKEIATHWVDKDTRFIYSEKVNGGLSSARNHGIEVAKGKYIQLLDADDTIESGKLEEHVQVINSGLDTRIITYSASRYFTGVFENISLFRGKAFSHVELTRYDSHADNVKMIFGRNICVVSAPLYPIELFTAIGGYDISFPSFEDWDFNMSAILHGYKFHYIGYKPGTRTLIRVNENSMLGNPVTISRAWQMLRDKHRKDDIHGYWDVDLIPKEGAVAKFFRVICPPVIYSAIRKVAG